MAYNEFLEKTSYVGEPDISGNYTAADFITWQYQGFVELIRGKIHKMAAAPHANHQEISVNILRELFVYFSKGGPCSVFHTPFDVYFVHPGEEWQKAKNVAEPDICIVCDKAKIHKRGCVGSPDLIVEITSPSSKKYDVHEKFSVYEEYGVREYWIVNPADETVIINVLEDRKYKPAGPIRKGDELRSVTFPEIIIDTKKLFPETGA